MAGRISPTWETVHTDTRGKTVTAPDQKRLNDHENGYHKNVANPLPADWWDWHCEVCGGPITDKPTVRG
jgi:hypothetical protein